MKIQNIKNKATVSTQKRKSTTTLDFDTLFTAQNNINKPESTPTKHEHTTIQQRPNLENALLHLETSIAQLMQHDESTEKTQHKLTALQHAIAQSELTPQHKQEAQTLLSVEAKRLASLQKKTP